MTVKNHANRGYCFINNPVPSICKDEGSSTIQSVSKKKALWNKASRVEVECNSLLRSAWGVWFGKRIKLYDIVRYLIKS